MGSDSVGSDSVGSDSVGSVGSDSVGSDSEVSYTGGQMVHTDVLEQFWAPFKSQVDSSAEVPVREIIDALDAALGPHLFMPRVSVIWTQSCSPAPLALHLPYFLHTPCLDGAHLLHATCASCPSSIKVNRSDVTKNHSTLRHYTISASCKTLRSIPGISDGCDGEWTHALLVCDDSCGDGMKSGQCMSLFEWY